MVTVRFTPNLARHVDCPATQASGHTVREVLDHADRVTVMRGGATVLMGEAAEDLNAVRLAELMVAPTCTSRARRARAANPGRHASRSRT